MCKSNLKVKLTLWTNIIRASQGKKTITGRRHKYPYKFACKCQDISRRATEGERVRVGDRILGR